MTWHWYERLAQPCKIQYREGSGESHSSMVSSFSKASSASSSGLALASLACQLSLIDRALRFGSRNFSEGHDDEAPVRSYCVHLNNPHSGGRRDLWSRWNNRPTDRIGR
jgi:hypothetical protein